MNNQNADPRSPFRGCLYAVSISLALWAVVIIITLILIKLIGG